MPGATVTQWHAQYPSVISSATHIGIDLSDGCGADVFSFADGVVERVVLGVGENNDLSNSYRDGSDWYEYTGTAIMLRHDNGSSRRPYYTTYLHFEDDSLRVGNDNRVPVPGMTVKKGERIGSSGRTGKTNGRCHTHFEVKKMPLWGGRWRRPESGEYSYNIYGLGDVRTTLRRPSASWYDPIDVFCRNSKGISGGAALQSGCADLVAPPVMTISSKRATFGETIDLQLLVKNKG